MSDVSSEHIIEAVCIVGPGRLGGALRLALAARGVAVTLVGRLEAPPPCPITLLTVPDRAIAEVARTVPPGGVLLHCSGATDVEVLRPHRPAGSLHPLMTFPGPEAPDLRDVPVAIAGDPEALLAAGALARLLGMRPFVVPGDRRLYHAAAVMAGNFSTALLAEASAVLSAAGVPPDQAPGLLAPLALASIRNAALLGPAAALTGPVARGDDAIIRAHQEALEPLDGAARAVYDTLLTSARALTRTRG